MNESPLEFFKYVPPERVDILENERVAFTPPLRFNDPFDLHPVVVPVTNPGFLRQRAKQTERELIRAAPRRNRGALRERLKQGRPDVIRHFQSISEPFARDVQSRLLAEVNKNFGVFCLCKSKNNLLMWAHYAASHRGFVLEFATGVSEFKQLGELLPVIYSSNRPSFDPVKGASTQMYCVKSEEWTYEGEFRIFSPLSNCKAVECRGTEVFFRSLSKVAIKAVYLGVNIDQFTTERIKAAVKGTQITLYQVQLPRTKFGLDFRQLD